MCVLIGDARSNRAGPHDIVSEGHQGGNRGAWKVLVGEDAQSHIWSGQTFSSRTHRIPRIVTLVPVTIDSRPRIPLSLVGPRDWFSG